jgi:hypothetical protein
VASVSSPTSPQTQVSGLDVDGLYRFRLTVDNGTDSDFDVMELRRGDLAALPPTVAILSPSQGSTATAGQPLAINVSASDSDGEVVRVDLYNGDLHLGALMEAPYAFAWHPPAGAHQLRAVAIDSDNLTATSAVVSFTTNPATPCRNASPSGDFEYQFSDDTENPTLTFIPSRTGVGSNIVIFYYGTGSGPYPGYIITPNTPFQINADTGQTIRFYFTYSVPEGGERNSIADNAAYTIGTCAEPVESDPEIALLNWQESHFLSGELANPELEAILWGDHADPDQDGLENIVEFIVGSHPLLTSPAPLSFHTNPATGVARIRFTRRLGLPAEFGPVERSTNLSDWTTTGTEAAAVSQVDSVLLLELNLDPSQEPAVFVRINSSPASD